MMQELVQNVFLVSALLTIISSLALMIKKAYRFRTQVQDYVSILQTFKLKQDELIEQLTTISNFRKAGLNLTGLTVKELLELLDRAADCLKEYAGLVKCLDEQNTSISNFARTLMLKSGDQEGKIHSLVQLVTMYEKVFHILTSLRPQLSEKSKVWLNQYHELRSGQFS